MPDEQRSMLDTLGVHAERITTAVDVSDFLDHKRRAMEAHASQISDTSFFLTMPPEAFAAVWGTEWYIRVGAARRRRPSRTRCSSTGAVTRRAEPTTTTSRSSSSGENETLLAFLGYLRDERRRASSTVLTDDDARRPLVPSGTRLLGLVKHLAFVEVYWIQRRFAGSTWRWPATASSSTPATPSSRCVTAYAEAAGRTDEIVAACRRPRTAPGPGAPRPHLALDARPPASRRRRATPGTPTSCASSSTARPVAEAGPRRPRVSPPGPGASVAETVSFCWPRYNVSWTVVPDDSAWTSLVRPWAEVTALPLKPTMTSPVRMPAVSAGEPAHHRHHQRARRRARGRRPAAAAAVSSVTSTPR